jgi:hypothetical protein
MSKDRRIELEKQKTKKKISRGVAVVVVGKSFVVVLKI